MRIHAENLAKRFNREWIFRNFNQAFESGKTYAIVGPNGSGKSTLLQVLWGQLPPSKGSVRYEQNNVSVPEEEIFRLLSIATPYEELIEEFTLSEMVRFHFRFKKPRRNLSNEDLIETIGLAHASEKRISNFSSGMRQRLKLGLAFLSDCPLLFLDEPTTNLDQRSVKWYWDQFPALPAETTIFIASNLENEYPAEAIKIDISAFK